ncbi:serpin family protein [Arachnia propionica]|uniref:Serpin domain-containing protein n=1 Tax=Arachnia propionica TaxID=1750 RepID=A0A3P1X176_9ACTN|nr:serpin family protein [Arachnia propionica]RRD51420.1 hypothetical protein EII35_00615 [Arachnia propionica]
MKLTRRTLMLGGLAAAALSGCGSTPLKPTETLISAVTHETFPPTTPHVAELAAFSRTLGWNILRSGEEGANRLLSPSSLISALVLVGLGASGRTASSLDAAFGMSAEERAAATNALRYTLAAYEHLPEKVDVDSPPEHPIAHQASRILLIDDTTPKDPFLDAAKRYFDMGVDRVARSDAEGNLHAWVKQHTAGLIETSAIEVTADTLLVLQDAILFAARWATEFSIEAILPFTTPTGTKDIEVVEDTLTCRYATAHDWQAIRLPYTEGFAMDVLLPPPGTLPLDAEADLITELTDLLTGATPQPVEVGLPKLDTRHTTDLLTALAGQGIELGEVGGIVDGAGVGQAMQQARLQISAKGTVGAAVTEITVETSAQIPPAVSFIVDRPYAINVIAEDTQWSLFLAAITDPTDKG